MEETKGAITAEEKKEEAKKSSIYERLAKEVKESSISEEDKTRALSRLAKISKKTVHLMLVGPTAAGKSSTINALFDMEKAKVGIGVDPETQRISSFVLENLTIWDTPGLGDGIEKDAKYMGMIREKLSELDENGDPLVDLVLVIADASQKDLGTVYDCINSVLIPSLGKDAERRILIGLNQADMAMKGKHWNETLNCPDAVLTEFLEKKCESVKRRIEESTGITFKPVYYAAGYKEEGGTQKPYNVIRLLYTIISAVPKEKRLAFADVLNPDPEMWEDSDEKKNYKAETGKKFWEAVKESISECADNGAEIGYSIARWPGEILGRAIGGVTGVFVGIFKGIFSR